MKSLNRLMLLNAAILLCASPAVAQEPSSVRLSGGVAVDGNSTQPADKFYPGIAGMGKLTFNLTPALDVAPSVGTVQMPTTPGYSGWGGFWAVGGGLRLKRPHNLHDSWMGVSPWVDGDVQYLRSYSWNRVGLSVGVGIATPVDNDRKAWLGPYLRFTDVPNDIYGAGDRSDAKIVSAGLELEFDFGSNAAKKSENKPVAPAPVPAPTPEPTMPPAQVATANNSPEATQIVHRSMPVDYKVQFEFASAKIRDTNGLNIMAESIVNHLAGKVTLNAVAVNGYASDEHHAWAEKFNQKLSEDRAQAVVDYLVSRGVPQHILTAKGFGTANPRWDNSNERGRELNRRVEFVVSVTYVKSHKQ